MPPDKLALVAEINNKFGVPYSYIERLLGITNLRDVMRQFGRPSVIDSMVKLSPDQVDAICVAYLMGVEQSTLAVIAGVDKMTIAYHVNDLRGRKLSQEQVAALRRAKEAGISLGDLAVMVNVHPAAVIAALKRGES